MKCKFLQQKKKLSSDLIVSLLCVCVCVCVRARVCALRSYDHRHVNGVNDRKLFLNYYFNDRHAVYFLYKAKISKTKGSIKVQVLCLLRAL